MMLSSLGNIGTWCVLLLAGLFSLGCNERDHQSQSVCIVMQSINYQQRTYRSSIISSLKIAQDLLHRSEHGEPKLPCGPSAVDSYRHSVIEVESANAKCLAAHHQRQSLVRTLMVAVNSGSAPPTQEQLSTTSSAIRRLEEPFPPPCLTPPLSSINSVTLFERMIAIKAWSAESEAREKEAVQACRKVVEAQ